MENFDAIGRWRDYESIGHKVDASATLPDGRKFSGAAELKRLLVEHPEQFVQTVTEKLLMYSLGRNVQYYDAPIVRRIVHDAARRGYTFESLVLGVAQSAPFQMRKVQPPAAVTRRAGL
jgi:hypothetical protein